MIMLGAIIGDIVGSRFEWNNYKAKDFELFTDKCFFTDDSIMTLALCEALLNSGPDYLHLEENAISCMQAIGRPYPKCGYGTKFHNWIYSDKPQPYASFGNGAAMRVSGCAYVAESLAQAIDLAHKVTAVTHNHPEGIKGAQAVVVAIFLAREGKSQEEIKRYIYRNYYKIDFKIDRIRPVYEFNETCQNTVPQALEAFFEARSFEDAIRIAISLGGDSDTIAAITGSVAEAYFGIPKELRKKAISYLDARLLKILQNFEQQYSPKIAL